MPSLGLSSKVFMKKLVLFFAALFLIGTLTSEDALAQKRKPSKRSKARRASGGRLGGYGKGKKFPKIYKYVTLGGVVGYSNYYGDLAPNTGVSTAFHLNTPYLGVFATKRLNNILTLRANIGWARLFSDDYDVDYTVNASYNGRYLRNLHFRNNILEGMVTMTVDLFSTNKGAQRRPLLNPYVWGGVGFFLNNPQAMGPRGTRFAEQWYDLTPLKTSAQGQLGNPSAASAFQVMVPVGIGARYRLNDLFDVGFEIAFRYTFTDAIDDVVSTGYPDIKSLDSELARRLSNRTGEIQSAISGDTRQFLRPNNSVVSFNDPSLAASLKSQTIDGIQYTTLDGVNSSTPRGNEGRDGYLVTSFQLHYILTNVRFGPRRY